MLSRDQAFGLFEEIVGIVMEELDGISGYTEITDRIISRIGPAIQQAGTSGLRDRMNPSGAKSAAPVQRCSTKTAARIAGPPISTATVAGTSGNIHTIVKLRAGRSAMFPFQRKLVLPGEMEIKAGDLIGFSGRSWISAWHQLSHLRRFRFGESATLGSWRTPPDGRLLIFESTSLENLPCEISHENFTVRRRIWLHDICEHTR